MPVVVLQGEIIASTIGEGHQNNDHICAVHVRTRNGLLECIFRKMIDEIRHKGLMKQLGKYMGS